MGHSGKEWAAIAIVLLYDWFSGFFLNLYFLIVAKVEVFFQSSFCSLAWKDMSGLHWDV